MRKLSRYRILFIAPVLLLAACTLVQSFLPSAVGGVAQPAAVLIGAPPNATPTPTAFQPLAPTPTYQPTLQPTQPVKQVPIFSPLATSTPFTNNYGSYPGPSVYPPIAIPAPMGILPQPKNQINILLMGSDQRPFDGGFRTDVLLLLTLNTDQQSASVTSFPRDLYVYIPGWTIERINTAQARGGFELTSMTFEYNFGVKPDHWAMVNFDGFMDLIDSLGGIEVQVGQTLTDQRDGRGQYTVKAGPTYMDGETALWYVRSRYTSSDFDRGRRQQEVLIGIFFRLISLNAVAKAPELFNEYKQTIQTDLTVDDILPLLPLATQLADNDNINRYQISPNEVTPWTNPYNGAMVLLPIQSLIKDVMKQALNIP